MFGRFSPNRDERTEYISWGLILTTLTNECEVCGVKTSPTILFFCDDCCKSCFRKKEIARNRNCLECDGCYLSFGKNLSRKGKINNRVVNREVLTYCLKKSYIIHPFDRGCIKFEEAVA